MTVTAGGAASVHVFWASTRSKPDGSYSAIGHLFFDGKNWEILPDVLLRRIGTPALQGVTAKAARVHLIWPDSHDPRLDEAFSKEFLGPQLFMLTWSANGKSTLRQISDSKSRLSIMRPDQIAIVEGDDESLDVFWIDHREYHFFRDLATMGHAGTVRKAFHRRWRNGAWSKPVRVQERGIFDVDNISAIRDAQGLLHSFWTQANSKGLKDLGLFHAVHAKGRWGKAERIDGPILSYDGKAGVATSLEAAKGTDGTILVARQTIRYPDKSGLESHLEIFRLAGGNWTKVAALTGRSIDARWASGPNGAPGMVIQKCTHSAQPPEPGEDEPLGHPLFFFSTAEGSFGIEELITEEALDGAFDAVSDAPGTSHLVYFSVVEDRKFALVYQNNRSR